MDMLNRIKHNQNLNKKSVLKINIKTNILETFERESRQGTSEEECEYLTWQLQASVCSGGALQRGRLWAVHHLCVKGVGLPVHHRQSKSQPLSVRLSSETTQRCLSGRSEIIMTNLVKKGKLIKDATRYGVHNTAITLSVTS